MSKENETKKEMPENVTRTFRDRVRERYPDRDPQNDEETEAMYMKYADDSENEVNAYKEQAEKINEILSTDEDAAAVISDMIINKIPFRVALAKCLSADDLIVEENEPDYDAYKKAYDERVNKTNQRKELQTQVETNEQDSIAILDEFCKQKGYSQEQSDNLNSFMQDIFSNLLYKKITPEMLAMFDRAMNFDTAVASAEKEGEIRGKNAAIEAKRVKESQKSVGDGIPELGANGGNVPEKSPNDYSFIGKSRRNI